MAQPLAILDIDDVLSDTTPFMLSELNRRHGTDYRVDDMNAFYLWDAFNIPAQHVLELILSVEFQRGCPVLAARRKLRIASKRQATKSGSSPRARWRCSP